MRTLFPACFAFLVLTACGPNTAPPASSSTAVAPSERVLAVSDGWAPLSPTGVDVGAGYLTITNATTTADALVEVSTPRAGRSEIHEMASDGPVMRMRAVPRLEIPAGQTVTLGPGGLHLMFHELDHGFAAGESVPVRLVFEHAGPIETTLSVRARNESHAQH
jgi:copper(I)-binding protein